MDRRIIIGAGALVAVGVGVAVALGLNRGEGPTAPPPASEGGLQIEVGAEERAGFDAAKPLRCFVDGRFVGIETLARCAERNGVSAQALDVGLDETGAVAAATDAMALDPLPGVELAEVAPFEPAAVPAIPAFGPTEGAAGPADACMKHGAQGWSVVSESAPLGTCVSLLFDGRCEEPGNALYGRWGQRTVRLVPGKVEIAEDDRSFRTLVDQGPNCSVPAI